MTDIKADYIFYKSLKLLSFSNIYLKIYLAREQIELFLNEEGGQEKDFAHTHQLKESTEFPTILKIG